ncbi:MAG: FtsQ-type POTRA domain-containing protein [Proteobacteria bacterium]|nr:FtsQ-type POTRA domain-containing protein [Pseudomonadota bacterium]
MITTTLMGVMVGGVCLYDDVARVSAVEVIGNVEAADVGVRHLADVTEGEALVFVDLEDVIEGVTQHPWIDEATVSRAWPDRIVIEVVEHTDVLLVAHQGLYRVNGEGELFVRARSSDLDLPVLTGLDDQLVERYPAVGRRIVREGLVVHGAVRDTNPDLVDELSEIHFDRQLGFSLKLRNATVIDLGFQPPAEALDRLALLRESGLDLSSPHEVDLDLVGLAIATPVAVLDAT